jgi:hypothetical protein
MAVSAEVYGEHIALLTSMGRLAALFSTEVVESGPIRPYRYQYGETKTARKRPNVLRYHRPAELPLQLSRIGTEPVSNRGVWGDGVPRRCVDRRQSFCSPSRQTRMAFTRGSAFPPKVRLTQNRADKVPVSPWDVHQKVAS